MTRRLGIIGHPVAHSLSPVFQLAALRHSGFDVSYELWDTPLNALSARVASLRLPAILGANVTVPHKQAVIPLLDEVGNQAAVIGAVNTIVNRHGRLFGFNTDGQGFVRSLKAEASFDVAGRETLLIGAGGAARGIAFALLEANVAHVTIANRTPARAVALARDLEPVAPGRISLAGWPATTGEFDLVVNATSVGMEGGGAAGASPCAFDAPRRDALAVDIVYVPAETPFLKAARSAGRRTLDGLPMLIYQGALAFELWTGAGAPIDVMFEAARRELARRQSVAGAH